MKRRAFLRALGIGAAGVALAPYLPALPTRIPPQLVSRKIMGRIRVTQELMEDAAPGAFAAASRAEMQQLKNDMFRRGYQWALWERDEWVVTPPDPD